MTIGLIVAASLAITVDDHLASDAHAREVEPSVAGPVPATATAIGSIAILAAGTSAVVAVTGVGRADRRHTGDAGPHRTSIGASIRSSFEAFASTETLRPARMSERTAGSKTSLAPWSSSEPAPPGPPGGRKTPGPLAGPTSPPGPGGGPPAPGGGPPGRGGNCAEAGPDRTGTRTMNKLRNAAIRKRILKAFRYGTIPGELQPSSATHTRGPGQSYQPRTTSSNLKLQQDSKHNKIRFGYAWPSIAPVGLPGPSHFEENGNSSAVSFPVPGKVAP